MINKLNEDFSYSIYIDKITSDISYKQRNLKLKLFNDYENYAIMC